MAVSVEKTVVMNPYLITYTVYVSWPDTRLQMNANVAL